MDQGQQQPDQVKKCELNPINKNVPSSYFDLDVFLVGRKHLSNLVVDVYQEHEGTHILQSLDGFAISLNADGRFLYISETVSIYLGLSQVRH